MNLLAAELVSARFAHEPRPAIDLSAARTALGGFAVPSAGEGVCGVRLDVMDGVGADPSFQRGRLEALLPAAVRVSAEDLEDDRAAGPRTPALRNGRSRTHVRTGCGLGGRGAGGWGAGGGGGGWGKKVPHPGGHLGHR